jgi:TldD protein
MEKALANELLHLFLSKGYDEVEIFHEAKQKCSLLTNLNKLGQPEWKSTYEFGVGVRLENREGMKYLYYPMSLQALLEQEKSNGKRTFQITGSEASYEERQISSLHKAAEMALVFDELQEEWSKGLGSLTLAHNRGRQTVHAYEQRMMVARSDGAFAVDQRNFYTADIVADWMEGTRPCYMDRSIGAALSFADMRLRGFSGFVQSTLADLEDLRGEDVKIQGGDWCVVLGPGNPAILIHEVCGHGFEGDLAAHPQSMYGGQFGQLVASEQVTLVDDPTSKGLCGSYQIDDEGEDVHPTVLISKGRLVDFMYDRTAAKQRGRSSNGHGRRISYRYPAIPRMSNTFIQAGEYAPEEIVRQTSKGLYVRTIGDGETELATGRFRVRVVEGFLIENGRITRPVRNLWLVGNGPELLRSIDRVGNDFEIFSSRKATCNKMDQQNLPVSVGQPTLRVKKIQIETD